MSSQASAIACLFHPSLFSSETVKTGPATTENNFKQVLHIFNMFDQFLDTRHDWINSMIDFHLHLSKNEDLNFRVYGSKLIWTEGVW